MKIYRDLNGININKPVITTGFFDGVHLGHQTLLNAINQEAKAINGESVVITFWPHPRFVTENPGTIRLINTLEEKEILFEKMGVDHLIVLPFTKKFSDLTARGFLELIHEKISFKKMVVGYNHHFGKNREGDYNLLKSIAPSLDFEPVQLNAKMLKDEKISSTEVRNYLDKGEISNANRILGYEFFVSGAIVRGKGLGRTIGYPTANLKAPYEWKLIPKDGVYAVKIQFENRIYHGMLNIGVNPTINEGNPKTIEVNIFDFNREIYDMPMEIIFCKRLRDERKFNSLEELKTWIDKDKQQTLEYFNMYGDENKFT